MASSIPLPDFFAFRTPLLSFDEWLRWTSAAGTLAPDDPELEQKLAAARAALRASLHELVQRLHVREAIFLVSSRLWESIEVWIRDPEAMHGQQIERLLISTVSGLLTSVEGRGIAIAPTLGSVGEQTALRVDDGGKLQRDSRLSYGFLHSLAQALGIAPAMRSRLPLRRNTSLYATHQKVRFVSSDAASAAPYHRLVTTPLTPYLACVLERSEHGALRAEVAQAIESTDAEIGGEEAESYVDELIDEDVLVPELGPPLTDANPTASLVAQLETYPEAAKAADSLKAAARVLADFDCDGREVPPQRYREVSESLSTTSKLDPSSLVHVRLFRGASTGSVQRRVLEEMLGAAETLRRIERAPDRIRRFTESFFARYGEDEVPLVEALDDKYGIGFESAGQVEHAPLLDGLSFPARSDPVGAWGAREGLLLRKIDQASRSGSQVIALDAAEIDSVAASDALPLPDSFSIFGAIASSSEESLAQGDYSIRFDRLAGPPAAAWLAPFCDLDAGLRTQVDRCLRSEEALHPEATWAEIVHLPDGADADRLARPLLAEHEIPYLGRSGAVPERRIPITDLWLSVVGERLRLTSRRLGREIIPRLTAPHDGKDRRNLPAYRFLFALQAQGTVSGLSWSWGALEDAAFLPRVMAGRVVLCRARWRIDPERASSVGKGSAADRFRGVQMLRDDLRLPRFIELTDGTQRLAFDLDNALSADCFLERIRQEARPSVEEMFPSPDHLCARGPEGRFVHQLIVPFVRANTASPITARTPALGLQRSFQPGSEWLQINLYTGVPVADEILREGIDPSLRRMEASGAVDTWYFVRYVDPQFHLRLRLHGVPGRLLSEAWPMVLDAMAPLVQDRRLSSVRLDTYVREAGRYGGREGILLAEQIFAADSAAVLAIVRDAVAADDPEARWRIALYGVHALLLDLSLSKAERLSVLEESQSDLVRRLKVEARLDRQLVEKYEGLSSSLKEMLASPGENAWVPPSALAAFEQRSAALAPLAAALRRVETSGQLSRTIREQAFSYIHMFANRLLASNALQQELVLYDLLKRFYLDSG